MKNIFPVSRTQYEALRREVEAAEHERDAAFAERMAMEDERDAATTQAQAARSLRDELVDLLAHALTLLQEVNATRTGGKPWDDRRTALFTDAKEHGLWAEHESGNPH